MPPPAMGGAAEAALDLDDLVRVEMVSDDETRRDDVSGRIEDVLSEVGDGMSVILRGLVGGKGATSYRVAT